MPAYDNTFFTSLIERGVYKSHSKISRAMDRNDSYLFLAKTRNLVSFDALYALAKDLVARGYKEDATYIQKMFNVVDEACQ